ncbi:MAG: haloacid dehalogenase-like hydrolase [Lachnospiraceae bacterium]|nr:haloacid dehalogenase-like hydrolase [Lachnospiraceae bacterium]
MDKKKISKWMYVAIAAIGVIVVLCIIIGVKSLGGQPSTGAQKVSGEEMLNLWNDDAKAKQELISYVESITDEESKDFIPVERRIAVFDMDGTLCSETNPTYFDCSMYMYRILEDESYRDKASDFEKDLARRFYDTMMSGGSFDELLIDHGKAVASAFKGMSVDEFEDYVKAFREMPAPGYENMTRGESFYKPMVQVVDYLKANDFKVYIVSGTDRFIVRGLIKDNDVIDLPMNQLIGSDESIAATNQNGEDGLTYQFSSDDETVLGGDFLIKNLKMNKVSAICREIGVQPVLSFGNSSGDQSMAEYVTSNNKYKSAAFMLCCDDLEREYGNQKSADKMYGMCDQYGWTPISMKNDWLTIYGDNVVKTSDTKPNPFPIENLDSSKAGENAA